MVQSGYGVSIQDTRQGRDLVVRCVHLAVSDPAQPKSQIQVLHPKVSLL